VISQIVNLCRISLAIIAGLLLYCAEVTGGGILQDPIPSLRGRILAGPAAQGETGSVTSEGAEAILYNPAGVIIDGRWDFAFSVKTIENDVFQHGFNNFSYKSAYLGMIFSCGRDIWIIKNLTFGLSGYYFGIGGLQRIGYDDESCEPVMTNSNDNGYYDLVIGPTAAVRINVPGGDLDLGINTFYHQHQMFGESIIGFPVWDLGIKVRIGPYKSGARLRYIPAFYRNNTEHSDWRYLDTGFSHSWDWLTFSVQIRYDQNEEVHWSWGTEWDLSEKIKFRTGYINADGFGKPEQVNKGWTLGGGILVSEAFTVDVCYHDYNSIFGIGNSDLSWLETEWLFSLKYNKK